MVEFDIVNMFMMLPTKLVYISILFFCNTVITHLQHRNGWVTVGSNTIWEGRTYRPGLKMVSTKCVFFTLFWSVCKDCHVLFRNTYYTQEKGVPIGGLLSAQIAEMYCLFCEVQDHFCPTLHPLLMRWCKTSLIRETCGTDLLALWHNYWSQHLGMGSIPKTISLYRYRDNVILFCTENLTTIQIQQWKQMLQFLYGVRFTVEQEGQVMNVLGMHIEIVQGQLQWTPNFKDYGFMIPIDEYRRTTNYSTALTHLCRAVSWSSHKHLIIHSMCNILIQLNRFPLNKYLWQNILFKICTYVRERFVPHGQPPNLGGFCTVGEPWNPWTAPRPRAQTTPDCCKNDQHPAVQLFPGGAQNPGLSRWFSVPCLHWRRLFAV